MAEEKPPVLDQATQRAKALADKLWFDKTPAGAAYRKMAKETFPDITIPEDTAELAVAPLRVELGETRTQLADALKRISAREKADSDMQAEVAMSQKIDAASREFGLTDSGREKMITRMKETGNFTDAQAAAAYVVSQMPKVTPTNTPTWMPQESNLFGSSKKEERWEALHTDPRKYMDDEIRAFVADPQGYTDETNGRTN